MSMGYGRFRTVLIATAATVSLLAGAPVLAETAKPKATTPKTTAEAGSALGIDIPFDKFTLPNGLRVIVHTDRKAPVVAVSVWYHVGSKDERLGRTGFAHLFEHLMFQGSENYKGEWFKPFEDVGVTDQNGTTSLDRTNYFQTVPTTALDMTLWLESDRMGHFINSVDQAKLDEQRDVVKNEKRQGDNQPYGRVEYQQQAGLFPGGHPYSWTTIGSMEDLSAASLDDVKEWFTTHYGPSNAVLVLAGDIDLATAKTLVTKYFADIPAGPPLPRKRSAVPDRDVNTRDVLEDRVPQTLLDRYWATPPRTDRDTVLLYLAAQVLGGGKTSRLFKTMVHDKQLATSASASLQPYELTSMFNLAVRVRPGVDAKVAEKEADAVLAAFLKDGPTAAELDRAKTSFRAEFIRGLEKVGGFGGKATILAEGELYAGDAGFFRTEYDWLLTATPADVAAVARRWLSKGWHQVDVVPFTGGPAATEGADRSQLPSVTSTPDLNFPVVETGKLANGIEVSLARRPGLPVIDLNLIFDAGYAADTADRPGIGALTANMMDEGTKTRTSQQIADEAEGLGMNFGIGSNLDQTRAGLSALKDKLQPSLALFADIVRNPSFPKQDLERLRPRVLAGIAQEKVTPNSLAFRLLPPALYGKDHPYGKSFTGSGSEAVVSSVTVDDLKQFHETWIRPDNAHIIAVGDISMAELTAALNKAFGDWKAPSTAKPTKTLSAVANQKARVALIDRPDSDQTLIMAGRLVPPSTAPGAFPLDAVNDVLGGLFSSRLNLNLREDKHWSYGAGSFFAAGSRGQRPWVANASVQTDKTAESLAEINKELTEIRSSRPVTAEELDAVVKSNTRSLPGSFETNGVVLGQLTQDYRLGRPFDYITTVKAKYQALTLADVAAASKELVATDDLLWVIIGDRKKIEDGVKKANLGPVEYWDVDGNKLP